MVGAQKFIQITNIGGLRKLTITNPKKRNALNVDAYAELTGGLFESEMRFIWFDNVSLCRCLE